MCFGLQRISAPLLSLSVDLSISTTGGAVLAASQNYIGIVSCKREKETEREWCGALCFSGRKK